MSTNEFYQVKAKYLVAQTMKKNIYLVKMALLQENTMLEYQKTTTSIYELAFFGSYCHNCVDKAKIHSLARCNLIWHKSFVSKSFFS